ncbi:MAG: hypothetical protein ACI8O8_001675 [Oleiphilaceae bacterium]|jgi:uncharacterized protein (TIGR01777 family)
MRVLITGGTGLIGQALIKVLLQEEYKVVLLTRDKDKPKHSFAAPFPRFDSIVENLDQVDFNKIDAVINLAGEPIVNKRWTAKQKLKLCNSRWQLTSVLASKILAAETPPAVFISGSAIGVYGRQGANHIDESYQEFYPEFSSKLCREWEELALKAQTAKTRVCVLRTGIVLDQHGGALAKMLPAFRLGLGGPIASGQQGMSWIHIQDMVNLIVFLLKSSDLQGAFNATAPEAVSNKVFSQTLAKQLNRPCIFWVPAFVLKLAMGEMSELLICGQYVYPKRLLDAGFQFRYKQLNAALKQVIS